MIREHSWTKTVSIVPDGGLLPVLVAVTLGVVCLPTPSPAASGDGAAAVLPGREIPVSVDPRVELIGIVFRLAGNPEYNDGILRPYAKAIERHFGDFDEHPVVKLAAGLRYKRSMSCDGPMSLTVHIDRTFHPRKTFEQWPWGLDGRWEKQETADFLEKLREFAAETKFDEFFEAQSALYEEGIRSCKASIGPL